MSVELRSGIVGNCVNRILPQASQASFKTVMERILADPINCVMDEDGKVVLEPIQVAGLTHRELVCLQLITKACQGDLEAIRLLLDRIEGKAIQRSVSADVPVSYLAFLQDSAKELIAEAELL